MMRSSSSTAMWCVSRSESLASAASTRDLSSAIAAFFDGVAPAVADDGGGGAAPPPADAALEPGFGGGGGCAVVGDLGWDLTADLESAVAIAVGIWSMRGLSRGRSRNGEVRFELVGAGFGCQSGAFGGEFEVDSVRFVALLDRSSGLEFGVWVDLGMG